MHVQEACVRAGYSKFPPKQLSSVSDKRAQSAATLDFELVVELQAIFETIVEVHVSAATEPNQSCSSEPARTTQNVNVQQQSIQPQAQFVALTCRATTTLFAFHLVTLLRGEIRSPHSSS